MKLNQKKQESFLACRHCPTLFLLQQRDACWHHHFPGGAITPIHIELYNIVTLGNGAKKHCNHKIDAYSLAIVLWELILTKFPFGDMSHLHAAYFTAFKVLQGDRCQRVGLQGGKMKFNSIAEVSIKPNKWALQVRISRSWLAINTKFDTVLHRDFILIDAKGNDIWAQVPLRLMPNFAHIEEQKVYNIQHFKVLNAPKVYRPISNRYVIEFSDSTIVEENENCVSIPQYKFTFIKESEIPLKLDRVLLSDTIRYVVEYRKPEHAAHNCTWKELILRISREFNVLVLVWGKLMAVLDKITSDNENNTFVLIVTSVFVRTFNDQKALSTTSATQFYANALIPEIAEFETGDMTCRYRIQLEVRDATDESEFILLDYLAKSVLGLTAKKLYELNGNDTEIPPVLVMNLEDKAMKVQVQVTDYNIRTARNEFTITKILEAPRATQSPTSPEHVKNLGESPPSSHLPKSCVSKLGTTSPKSSTIIKKPDKKFKGAAVTYNAEMEDELSDDAPLATIRKKLKKRKCDISDDEDALQCLS
ncbi:hypothetical protein LINPERHAP2_LOCUS25379 [Linum perenne]